MIPTNVVLGRPVLEVGWRLVAEHWGHGHATEGGRASLTHAFKMLGKDEVVSWNGERPSRRAWAKRPLAPPADRRAAGTRRPATAPTRRATHAARAGW
ncbi:MAG: hypothetical protein E6I44_07585 [Chloroflexi bacterium]|nr:MAG: hypothetical protein E6I44_07585 [Chloroflexota bacterium]